MLLLDDAEDAEELAGEGVVAEGTLLIDLPIDPSIFTLFPPLVAPLLLLLLLPVVADTESSSTTAASVGGLVTALEAAVKVIEGSP
jgi:hypothetical protein